MSPPRSCSRNRLVGRSVVMSLAVAASVPLAAQGFASAVGRVTIEKPVGATVVTGVLNQVSLPALPPAATPPAPTPGAAGAAVSSQAGQVPGSGQNNLITVFENGDAQLVSDTAVSVRVSPLVAQGFAGQLEDTLGESTQGPVMVIAQFN